MGRARITPAERALRTLTEQLAIQEAELITVAGRAGTFWDEFRAGCRVNIARTVTAIENVTAKGLPEGFTAKWADPEPLSRATLDRRRKRK